MDNVLVGHLCQDPILRQLNRGGRPLARFTVAVNAWRRVGEKFVERPPVFHRVVCFGLQAENVMHSLRKGMEVLAVGEWVDDSYSDEQGQRKVRVALEARAVGPTLRWATAAVVKVERTVERAQDAGPVQHHQSAPSLTERPAGLFDPETVDPTPQPVGAGLT